MKSVADRGTPKADRISRCAKRLAFAPLGPLIDDAFADEPAHGLHRAWPGLNPEEAANGFLSPEQRAA